MSVSAPRPPFVIGPPPGDRAMSTLDELVIRAPVATVFAIVADVERWPAYLAHYRWVTMCERATDGGGIVEMAANRPFGPLDWPTWWRSEMAVDAAARTVRFRHIGGITTRMEVEWSFHPHPLGTHATLLHVWNGPDWPLVGKVAAVAVIGPVFIHGIASRTIAGLGRAAEDRAAEQADAPTVPLSTTSRVRATE